MNNILKTILKILGSILFALSFSLVAILLIVPNQYNPCNMLFTSIVAFLSGLFIFYKTYQTNYELFKNNLRFSLILCILSLIVMLSFYQNKSIHDYELFKGMIFNPFRFRIFITSFLAIFYLAIYLGNKIKLWWQDFWHSLTKWDKYAYLISSLILMILIVIFYNMNTNWFLQYDKVYSLDSGFIFEKILPNASYYDIRHPLFSIFTFPLWSVTSFLVGFFFDKELCLLITAIILQIINAQFLIISGLMLKVLTKKKIVFIIYMLSLPTILFSFFFEKYQLCVFLLILYVYTICTNKDKSKSPLIAASVVMPTSSVIGISEFLVKDKFINKIKKTIQIVIIGVLTIISLGRAHILEQGLDEIKLMRENYSNILLTTKEKMVTTTKMIEASFISLPSSTQKIDNRLAFSWNNLETNFSIISIIIIIIILIGIISNHQELFVKIASCWLLFAFFLFIILSWSPHESPLFSIYFSWSIVPLFLYGIDKIITKIKINQKIIYSILIIAIIIINFSTILDISQFLNTF